MQTSWALQQLVFLDQESLSLIHSKTSWSLPVPQRISKSLSTFRLMHYKSLVTDQLMRNNISISNKYPTRSISYFQLEQSPHNLQLTSLRRCELEDYRFYPHDQSNPKLPWNYEHPYTFCIQTKLTYLANSLNPCWNYQRSNWLLISSLLQLF